MVSPTVPSALRHYRQYVPQYSIAPRRSYRPTQRLYGITPGLETFARWAPWVLGAAALGGGYLLWRRYR